MNRLIRQCLDRLCGRDQLSGLSEVQQLGHFAIDNDHALAGVDRICERRDDRRCRSQFIHAWRKNAVGRLDLRRVDQALAIKAQLFRFDTFCRETVRIVEIIIDAVDDIEAIGPCRDHRLRHHRTENRAIMVRPHFLSQIIETHDKSCQSPLRAKRGNFGELQNRLRHFDHRPELGVETGIEIFHEIGDLDDIIGVQYFRHQHGICLTQTGLLEDMRKPGRVHHVDAHDQFPVAIVAGLQRGAGIVARFFLGVRCHGIFEIEGGIVAEINSSWTVRVNRDELVEFQVDGTHGSAVVGLFGAKIQPRNATPKPVWNPDLEDTHDYDTDWQKVPTNDVFINGFRQQWEEYLVSFVEGTKYPFDLLSGARGVQFAEAGLTSSAEGRKVALSPLTLG